MPEGPGAGQPGLRWIDNHCHLELGASADDQIAAAAAAGVVRLIDVGTDLAHSRRAIDRAGHRPGTVFATVGVHPHEASQGHDGLEALLAEPGVVAVGECGLDYHYDHSPRHVQRRVFAAQIALAHRHRLPLVIHTREAWDDTFAVLDSEGIPARTVFHCFTGGPAEAEGALGRGAVLSFSGIVTFRNADALRQAVALTPPEQMMVETDSPYLAPEPVRGRPNTPANLPLVGARLAEVLGLPVAELAERLWDTTHSFYDLPPLSAAADHST